MEKFEIKKIKLIIGLGNPGQKYYKNRHSIGFRIIEELANKFGGSWKSKDKMEYAQIPLNLDESIHSIYLVKPQTFMNASGEVLPSFTKKGIKPDQILVIHDELEKDFGKISIRLGGSARGHNGLRSIIGMIGPDFWRLRFGVGRPEEKSQVSNYVLSNFTSEQEALLSELIQKSVYEFLM